MNSIDILDAIGNVDGEYVTKAKAKKTSCKKVWIALGSSLAACLTLFLAAPIMFAMRGASAPDPRASMSGESAVQVVGDELFDVEIYRVDGDKIGSITRSLRCSPEEIFAAWREANGIGDEVEFVKCSVEDNGVTTESEFNGEGFVTHTVGDYFVCNLTISQKIEDYYDTTDRELLLLSLKRTMTGYSGSEFDEFNLILV